MELPKKYDPITQEAQWQKMWAEKKVFAFNPNTKKELFSIDTPPPTVSGAMHLGHAFSFSQQDFIARYKRMKGFEVFMPFGTDDNGLATERLIEKQKKVKSTRMDRAEFTKLCLDTLENELRPTYVQDWQKIGMSCDWDIFYTTISPDAQKISQKYFLDLVKKDRIVRKEAAVLWCPQCHTALSQVEVEDVEMDSFFNDIIFKIDGKDVTVATTRPELLPACVAVFYHPDDERFKIYEGKKAKVPVFGFEVPILADSRVDKEKGTGLVMCCTFGDQTDIEWQKAFNLPIKTAFTPQGIMTESAKQFAGLKIKEARKEIIAYMKESGELTGQKPIKHPVNTHERCGTEIEFIHSPQWFIKYLDLKQSFLDRGNELNWHPKHMKNRYDNWVKGLQWDWCISRQRFSGVPFPVWYDKKTGEPIFAGEGELPVDPLKDLPKGYLKDQVIPEKDIMDTWATSSLTPQLAKDRFKESHPEISDKLKVMSLRPQAHDIISFWLFNTVVRSHIHNDALPWKDVMISGWALDPKGKKMSKSKGNVIAPQKLMNTFGADGIRFWAAGAKLGEDVAFQEKDMVTAKKTITKLFNASKFALMHLKDYDPLTKSNKTKTSENLKYEFMDEWLISKLHRVIKSATESFDNYEYSKAKFDTENYFWQILCDNYLEIAKDRFYNPDIYGEDKRLSGQIALHEAVTTVLKLFAPILPHITEEIYSWKFRDEESKKSIHVSKWPVYDESKINNEVEMVGDIFVKILSDVRKYKSENALSLKAELEEIKIDITGDGSENLKSVLQKTFGDLKASTKSAVISFGTLDSKAKNNVRIVDKNIKISIKYIEPVKDSVKE